MKRSSHGNRSRSSRSRKVPRDDAKRQDVTERGISAGRRAVNEQATEEEYTNFRTVSHPERLLRSLGPIIRHHGSGNLDDALPGNKIERNGLREPQPDCADDRSISPNGRPGCPAPRRREADHRRPTRRTDRRLVLLSSSWNPRGCDARVLPHQCHPCHMGCDKTRQSCVTPVSHSP